MKIVVLKCVFKSDVYLTRYRLFWGVAILSALLGLVGTVLYQSKAMLSYPTRMKMETKISGHLPFPAVTICNNNYVRKSQIAKYPGLEGFLRSRLDVKSVGSSSVANWSASLSNVLGHINDIEAENLRASAHTLEMTFVKCFWENKKRNCSELFTRKLTDSGVCHSFNSLSTDQRHPYISKTTGFNNGLYLLMKVNQEEYTATRRSNSAGFRVRSLLKLT